jgi:hypothetical protein
MIRLSISFVSKNANCPIDESDAGNVRVSSLGLGPE